MVERIKYLLKTFLWTVLIFIIAKVAFMLICHEAVPVLTIADVKDALVHGLSLDLSTALYFLIVPFLLTIASVWVHLPCWLFKVYNGIVAIAFSLAFVADTSLYPFWGFKLDASCLQYVESPNGITQSVSMGYFVWRIVVLVAVAVAIYKWLPGQPAKKRVDTHSKGKIAETAIYVLFMPLMVIGIRGGVHESTTNIGQVYFSQNQFLNHAAVNPVFSFLSSLGHTMGNTAQYQFMDESECREALVGVYTTESLDTDTLLTTQQPNILIILLESCGEEFASVMPRLQQLKREGVTFTQCYGNSWRTDRGTVCTLSGYPSFPSFSVMKMPQKSRSLPGIAKTLQQQGYATTYLYGGDINFTNMRSYLVATGWEQLISMDDFSPRERSTAQWGVRDDITFATLYDLLTAPHDDAPQLVGYSTLSSHEPWDVPTQTVPDDEVLNAFAYLDDCLGTFVDRLRQTPAWQSLLLVLTADHGINYKDINQSTPLEKNHIPMVWTGGAVKSPRTIDVLCNQSDLAATLLGQLQLPHDDYRFSRDVLSLTYRHPTAVHNYNNAQWLIDSTGHMLYDFNVHQYIVSESAAPDRLLDVSKAILQTTCEDLRSRGVQQ